VTDYGRFGNDMIRRRYFTATLVRRKIAVEAHQP